MLIKIIQFLPLIVFFASYKITSDLILATAMVVGACIVSSALEYLLTRTISRMQIFMLCAVILFGVPTVLLKDPSIIKWKVTVVNFILATAIFVSQELFRKLPFKYFLEKEISLPDEAFKSFGRMWVVFFYLAGLLNIVIAFYLPDLFGITQAEAESLWVDYKTFGNAILNGIFGIVCIGILYKKFPDAFKELAEKNK